MTTRHRGRARGQAMVEFAIAFPIFMVLMLGVVDLGRGIYVWNGLSQAAREIARTTSVHTGIVLGSSTQTAETVAAQRALVPGLVPPTPSSYACVDSAGVPVVHSPPCASGDYAKVTVTATFTPLALLGIGGPMTMSSTSSIEVP